MDVSSPRSAHGNACTVLGSLIFGTGEMAESMRSHDWSRSSLGPPEGWSDTLLSVVNLILASPMATALYWGPEHALLYNDQYRAIMGERHPSGLGQPGRRVWSEAWHLIGHQIEAAYTAGETTLQENCLVPIENNGRMEDCYWTYTFSPVRHAGQIVGVFNISHSTTATVMVDRQLSASEARARRVLESIGDAVIVTDEHGGVLSVNPVAEQLTGWSENDAQGLPLDSIFRIEDESTREAIENPAARVKRLDAPVRLANHTVLIRDDAQNIAIDHSAAPIRDDEGRLTGVVLVFHDVTERRNAELALRQSEEQTRFALETAKLGVWTLDAHTGEATRNLRHDLIFGYDGMHPHWSLEQFLGHLVPEERDRVSTEIHKAMQSGEAWEFESRIARLCDGQIRTIWVKGRPIRDAHGKITQFTGLLADITERRQADEALRLSEEGFRTLFELAPVGVCMSDPNTERILLTNAETARITGYSLEEMYTMRTRDFTHPEDQAGNEGLYQRLREAGGTPTIIEKRYLRKDGETIWVRVSARIARAPGGTSMRMLAVVQNITESRIAQTAMLQTEKLAVVGRLAASIAHEINNPLESVTNLLFLARTSPQGTDIQGYLDTAEQELRRVAAIASQTLRFHRQSTNPRSVSCLELIGSVLAIYQGRISNAQIVVEKRKRASCEVLCYDGEIRQVLSNLIGNAIDALPAAHGRLLVRSRDATDWRTGRPGLVLTVADNGCGMSSHTRKKIFDAFYTTKGNNGTGLGLWVSTEIVTRHGGRILVRSSKAPGRSGTVLSIFLPYEPAINLLVTIPN